MERIGRTSHNIPSGKAPKSLKTVKWSAPIHFVNGRTYSLRIIPKEKEIALPREWLERVRMHEYSSESVSWEAVIKLLLWLIAHNPEVMITNQQIADDLDVSVSVVVSAKNVLEKDFEAIVKQMISDKLGEDFFIRRGQKIELSAWWKAK